jgi:hypothetical protein
MKIANVQQELREIQLLVANMPATDRDDLIRVSMPPPTNLPSSIELTPRIIDRKPKSFYKSPQ